MPKYSLQDLLAQCDSDGLPVDQEWDRMRPVGRELTPNILFCGDLHGGFDRLIETVIDLAPAAIVLLGDIEAPRPLEVELASILDKTEVWWIPGNHDTDSESSARNLFGSALAHRNLHGRVVEVAGVRIAGLGGVFREKVWWPPGEPRFASYEDYVRADRAGAYRPSKRSRLQAQAAPGERVPEFDERFREGRHRKHSSSIFPDVFQRLAGQRADILVTHEAPSCHPNGFEAIDELARRLGVKTSFHGHHHDRLDYAPTAERLGFCAFGVGLRGISDQDGNVIVAGELDEARMHRRMK